MIQTSANSYSMWICSLARGKWWMAIMMNESFMQQKVNCQIPTTLRFRFKLQYILCPVIKGGCVTGKKTTPIYTCLTTLCLGLPRWARTRKVKPIWIYWSKRQGVAVASTGPYANLHLTPSRQPCQHPITQFFTGRMPFLLPNQQHQSTEGSGKKTRGCFNFARVVFVLRPFGRRLF